MELTYGICVTSKFRVARSSSVILYHLLAVGAHVPQYEAVGDGGNDDNVLLVVGARAHDPQHEALAQSGDPEDDDFGERLPPNALAAYHSDHADHLDSKRRSKDADGGQRIDGGDQLDRGVAVDHLDEGAPELAKVWKFVNVSFLILTKETQTGKLERETRFVLPQFCATRRNLN